MKIIYMLVGLLILSSCDKFLDEKSSASLATPSSLKDLQALLDSELNSLSNYPMSGDLGADYFQLDDAMVKSLKDEFRFAYLRSGESTGNLDWSGTYSKIFDFNVVLDNVDFAVLRGLSEQDRDQVKGAALFQRAWRLLNLAFIYAPACRPESAAQDLGLPLRTTADINKVYQRASLQETFQFIVDELKAAAVLLPIKPLKPTRPSKPAAFAALARTYLYIGNSEMAYVYADSCLQLKRDLIDYNKLIVNDGNPFSLFNPEVLLHNTMAANGLVFYQDNAVVSSFLIKSYREGDHRKGVFYKKFGEGKYSFKGDYGVKNGLPFFGLSTSEVYLTLAEAAVRIKKLEEAKLCLGELLKNRYAVNQIPNLNLNKEQLIEFILEERQKELAFRGGIRWADIKRLNKLYNANIRLTRIFEGKEYSLEPNDKRYACLIPHDVIRMGGLVQNER